MAVTMVSLFVGIIGHAINPQTPSKLETENNEIDKNSLQLACSVIFDLINDAIQALRNIIVLNDIKSVVLVFFKHILQAN